MVVNQQWRELAAALSLAPVAVLVLDRDRRVGLANAAAAELANRGSAAEFEGLTAGEAMGCVNRFDDPRGCGWGELCTICPLGTTVKETFEAKTGRRKVEGWLPLAGGLAGRLFLRISTNHVSVAGEERVLAFLEDLTAHRRSQEALRASEERYRHLVEDLNDVVYSTDVDGVLTYVSPASVRVLGYPAQELIGKHFSTIIYPEDRPVLERRFREVLQQWLGPGEYRYLHASGEVRWARTQGSPILRDGVVAGVQGVISDITQMRRMHEQLTAAQRMEALGQLAGGLAHDMNNILQAMASVVTLARLEARRSEDTLARWEELEAFINRGAALTRQLLLFSRRETARPEVLDLNRVVGDLLPMLRRLLRENVALEVALAGEELPVEADRGQLIQVLINLAVNAVDAMAGGGRLEIATGAWEGTVRLSVRDEGCGIPPEHLERIFEPFFTTKEAGLGTGIGLAVVHGVVTGLGGRVEVASVVGRGSTFTVILPRTTRPRHTSSAGVPAVPAPIGGGGRGEHILLVEDEEGIRAALAEVLVKLGYTVTVVGNAREAALVEEALEPAVLLTDLVLPDASGVDLAIRLVERWPRMAVIMMSGYTADEGVRVGSALGLVRFLQKPFEISRLAEEIRAALDERH